MTDGKKPQTLLVFYFLRRLINKTIDVERRVLIAIAILSMLESARGACTPPDCAPAEGWDNFANNLGSDLAPLLALFGEQVTTQYLSEAMSVEDCILFALAPLGIITAIVATIRVAGSSILRVIIGRAKETRGNVEADLMSSTSSDVCELWSGEDVVRVIGTPKLLQLVYKWSKVDDSGDHGHFDLETRIGNFQDKKVKDQFYHPPTDNHSASSAVRITENSDSNSSRNSNITQDTVMIDARNSDIERLRIIKNPPNLSLNLSMQALSRTRMASFIVAGIVVQGAVLVLAAVSQYHLHLPKNDGSIPGYAFPVFLFGTLILAGGVFLCATVVETSTDEQDWKPKDPGTTRVVWLQQGGQTVGDQMFESFARIHAKGEVKTSHKPERKGSQDATFGRTALAATAVGVTLLGFITQFFGLQATHSSVIVLQLVAILVMTAFRSYAHSSRDSHNDITDPDAVCEYELDWLAKRLGGCDSWTVRHLPTRAPGGLISSDAVNGEGTPPINPIDSSTQPTDLTERAEEKDEIEPAGNPSPSPSLSPLPQQGLGRNSSGLKQNLRPAPSPVQVAGEDSNGGAPLEPQGESMPQIVMGIRASLGGLSDDWVLKSRKTIAMLQQAIEGTVNDVFAKMLIKAEYQKWEFLEWRVPVTATQILWVNGEASQGLEEEHRVSLKLARKPDETGSLGDWTITTSELEAIFCLWVSSLTLFDRQQAQKDILRPKHIRLMGPVTLASPIDYKLWVQRTVAVKKTTGNVEDERYFGWYGELSDEYLCVETNRELEILCAQSLYTLFLGELAGWVDRVGGCTTQRENDSNTALPASNRPENSWTYFHLNNSTLASVAMVFVKSGLGTVEEAYQCIIPTLGPLVKPRYPDDIYQVAIDASKARSKKQDWKAAADMNSWLYVNSEPMNAPISDIVDVFTKPLSGLCEELLSKIEEPVSSKKRDMWDLIHFQCGILHLGIPGGVKMEIPDQFNADIAFANMTCAMTYMKSGHSVSKDLLVELVNRLMDMVGMEQSNIATITSAWDEGVFNQFENFAMFLFKHGSGGANWNQGHGNREFISAILRVRKCSGTVFSGREITRYLNNPPTSTAEKPNADLDDDAPVDILISRRNLSPVQFAASLGRRDIVEKLQKAGADLNEEPAANGGRLPLQAAADGGHMDLVVWLKERGVALDGVPARQGGRTALQAAAGTGNRALVELLLQDADVNSPPAEDDGRTALQAAAESGDEEIVQLLLDSGADIHAHAAHISGRTALQAAAGAGHTEIVRKLLSHGARANEDEGTSYGRTALQAAAENGHLDTVKFLLDHGVEVETTVGDGGLTALQAAAGAGHSAVVKLLLRVGVNVNACAGGHDGRTALQAAVEGGHRNTAEILLESNADIQAAPGLVRGLTVMEAAIKIADRRMICRILGDGSFDVEAILYNALGHGNHDLVKKILQMDGLDWNRWTGVLKETALHKAIRLGHNNIVERLVKIPKIDVNIPDGHGRSPLIAAARVANWYATEKLLEFPNILVNHHDFQRSTALSTAAESGDVNLVNQLLRQRNLDVNPVSADGCTPLHLAAKGGHDIVMLLLRLGGYTDAAAEDNSGAMALHFAAKSGCAKAVSAFFCFGPVEINRRDGDGATALLLAASGGHGPVVELLLTKSDIEVDVVDFKGQTPLDAAVRGGYEIIVELLLAHGADVNKTVLGGHTALHAAASGGFNAIVAILLDVEGVDADAETEDSMTPLLCAATAGDLRSVQLLIKKTGNVNHRARTGATALTLAVEHGDSQTVKALLDKEGIDLNLPGYGDMLPLHHAVLHRSLSILELLLEKDVKINAVTSTGSTALMHAASLANEITLTKLLEQPDIDVTVQTEHHRPAFFVAITSGQHLLVKPFMNRSDIDVNDFFSNRSYPLRHAAAHGYLAIVDLLLLNKANINQQHSEGLTPLWSAACNGHVAVVKRLLKEEALDVNLTGENESTALYVAAQNGHSGVIQLLLQRDGIDWKRPHLGLTPLMIAVENEHREVVDLLRAHEETHKNLPHSPSDPGPSNIHSNKPPQRA